MKTVITVLVFILGLSTTQAMQQNPTRPVKLADDVYVIAGMKYLSNPEVLGLNAGQRPQTSEQKK